MLENGMRPVIIGRMPFFVLCWVRVCWPEENGDNK